MITEEFLQQKLGELVYILGEKDFNCLTEKFYDKHVNHCIKFNREQVLEFKMFIADLLADLNIQVRFGEYEPILGMVTELPESKLPPIIDVLNKGKIK